MEVGPDKAVIIAKLFDHSRHLAPENCVDSSNLVAGFPCNFGKKCIINDFFGESTFYIGLASLNVHHNLRTGKRYLGNSLELHLRANQI